MAHYNILTIVISRDVNVDNSYYFNGVSVSMSSVGSMVLHANSTQLISTFYGDSYTIQTHQISF